MKKAIALFAAACVAAGAFAAETKAAEKPAASSSKSDLEWGVVFKIGNLESLVEPYEEGTIESGAGLKCSLNEKIALRGLVSASVTPDWTGESDTNWGLSFGAEYHAAAGKASPYLGGFAGVELATLAGDEDLYMDWYVGAMGGVELRVMKVLSFYGEYQALLTSTEDGISFALGDRAILGFVIYF